MSAAEFSFFLKVFLRCQTSLSTRLAEEGGREGGREYVSMGVGVGKEVELSSYFFK